MYICIYMYVCIYVYIYIYMRWGPLQHTPCERGRMSPAGAPTAAHTLQGGLPFWRGACRLCIRAGTDAHACVRAHIRTSEGYR